jgi:hypothetical protein
VERPRDLDPGASSGICTFEDNLSHNNDGSSIYFWVNNTPSSVIDRFTAYRHRLGIRAGSYTNLVSYRDTKVHACRDMGILVIAVPSVPDEDDPSDLTVTYENLYVDQAGMSDDAFEIGGHVVESTQVTRVIGCRVPRREQGAGRRLSRARRVPAARRVHRLQVPGHRVLAGRRPDRCGRHHGPGCGSAAPSASIPRGAPASCAPRGTPASPDLIASSRAARATSGSSAPRRPGQGLDDVDDPQPPAGAAPPTGVE